MRGKIVLILIFVSVGIFAKAEPEAATKKRSKFDISATMMTKHIWRAMPSGTAPTIEPIMTYSYNNLSVSAWSAYAFDNSYTEVDFWATYDFKYFQIGVYDYYCPNSKMEINEFTDYRSLTSPKLSEVQAIFKGFKQFPISISACTFVAGGDRDSNGNQQYSSYFELGYNTNLLKRNFDFRVGATPFKGMYADRFAVFNYSMKIKDNLKVGDKYQIPVQGGLTYNAVQKNLFFTFGITLK
ncbi:MAG: hypothetical protein JEZ03_04790 [Bacteroidales bacterium]|nr:hypothetical protein [Bacteroidales bacterium]